ncbi:uncharacterized protein ARMOST_12246 [Armillaria ostoyae]|uniref:Uncharacterized protein n=1 Tax=Armillaria ostoyae TaxID=47428 RepID=A0A284RJE1_ARMOS|nr:uncharacterized protein ARMOST_12246 [Armillaria ostoyae]
MLLAAGISCYLTRRTYGCKRVTSDFDTFELLAFSYHWIKAMAFLLCPPNMSRAGLGYQGQTEAIFPSGLGPSIRDYDYRGYKFPRISSESQSSIAVQ